MEPKRSSSGGKKMNIGGGGVTGFNPMEPGITEREQTAAKEGPKINLGMTPNDAGFVIPLAADKDANYKYSATPSNPSLHPLLFVRMSEPKEQASTAWMQTFEALVSTLPQNILEKFQEEGAKPFGERDPNFVALSNVLVLIAKSDVWLESIGNPIVPGTAEETLLMLNQSLPYNTLVGATLLGGDFIPLTANLLQNLGHASQIFDGAHPLLQEAKDGIESFQSLQSSWESGKITPEQREDAQALANTLFTLSKSTQNSFLILSSNLYAMGAVAQSIGNLFISPSLTLGLQVAFLANQAPFFGSTIDQMVDSALSPLFSLGSFDTKASANLQTFSTLAKVVLMAVTVSALLIAEHGVGFLPGDAIDQKLGRLLTLDLTFKALFSSPALTTVFKKIAQASGADEATETQTATILKLIALLQAMLAALYGNPEALGKLLSSFKKEMSEGVKEAANLAEKTDSEATEGSVLIQQGQVAIEQEDIEGLLNAFDGLPEILGLSHEKLKKEQESLKNLANVLMHTFSKGLEEETAKITTVSQAV
jgi:hypothetical protein